MGRDGVFRVELVPQDYSGYGARARALVLDAGQLAEMTDAMNYGSGWFPVRDGGRTTWFNLRLFAEVAVIPLEG